MRITIDQVRDPARCLLCSQRLVGMKERRERANVRHESVTEGTGLGEVRCPAGPHTYNSLPATMQRRASRADNCVCGITPGDRGQLEASEALSAEVNVLEADTARGESNSPARTGVARQKEISAHQGEAVNRGKLRSQSMGDPVWCTIRYLGASHRESKAINEEYARIRLYALVLMAELAWPPRDFKLPPGAIRSKPSYDRRSRKAVSSQRQWGLM